MPTLPSEPAYFLQAALSIYTTQAVSLVRAGDQPKLATTKVVTSQLPRDHEDSVHFVLLLNV